VLVASSKKGRMSGFSAKAGLYEAFVVEGGLDAWKRAGLPVAEDRRQPLPMMSLPS